MGTHPIFESDFDCLTEFSMSDEENYEVEDIVNHRHRKGKVEYLIRWKNYNAEDDTWEPEENLDCPDKIKAYNKKVKEEQASKAAKHEAERKSKKRARSDIMPKDQKKIKADGGELISAADNEADWFTEKLVADKIIG